MGTILQLLINSTTMGFIYILVTIEYTPIWNPTGPPSSSYDKVITVGVYIFATTFIIKFSMDKPSAIMLIPMLMEILGSVIALGIFNPLRHMRSSVFTATGAMMLGRILVEAIRFIYGPVPLTIENWLSGTIKVGTLMVTKVNVIICVVVVLVVAVLQLFMNSTKIGKAMRCAAQNKRATVLVGVNVAQNICMITAASSITCSVIGILIIPPFNISTTMVASISFKSFSAGVIGGFGHLPGVILGGLSTGVMENLAVVILSAIYKDVVSFILLIIFLLVYPNGFLGKGAWKE